MWVSPAWRDSRSAPRRLDARPAGFIPGSRSPAGQARAWRRVLTVEGVRPGAGVGVIEQGLAALQEAAARRAEFVAA
jgi:hypothetical protein